MGGKLAIVTGALMLLLAGGARAETFCVDAPGCTGVPQATLPEALTAAGLLAGPDRIVLGPDTYPGPFTADADNVVEVAGAGRGETVLTAPGPSATVLALAAPASTVSGVTVRLGAAGGMTGISAAAAEEVAIEGTGTGAVGFAGSSFAHGSVALGPGATGVRLTGPAALLENVTVRASSVGVEVAAGASATLGHVTLAGGNAGGTGLDVVTGGAATMSSAAITGFLTAIRTDAQCPVPCVATDHSAYDPALIAGTVTPGIAPPVSADPKLDDDLRPRYDSPLVDAGTPAVAGGTDASGAPRVVDGDVEVR